MKYYYLLVALLFTAYEVSSETYATRAQIKAMDRVVVSAELPAKVAGLNFKPGDSVSKGNVLVRLSCHRIYANKKVAQSKLNAARLTYQSNKRLLDLNSVGQLEVDVSKAELSIAQGELDAALADVSKCNIKAPFTSRIVERFVNQHQYVKVGEPLFEIYSMDSLEVHMVVDSSWLSKIKIGTQFIIYIDELKKELKGEIIRVGAVIDPVSQTVGIFGKLEISDEQADYLLPGMSGNVKFNN